MVDVVERQAAATETASLVRNRLAAAASLASLMFESGPQLSAYQRRLDVLARWTLATPRSVPLTELVRDGLAHALVSEQPRARLYGGDQRIMAHAVYTLAMAFSELAALAAAIGVGTKTADCLDVTWSLVENRGQARELRLSWSMSVSEPLHLALDEVTRMLLKAPEVELLARVSMDTTNKVFVWTLALPEIFVDAST